MRLRSFLLICLAWTGAFFPTGQAQAQMIGTYQWEVTHTTGLAAALTGTEATRATLEANIAAQKVFHASIWQNAVAQESYHALRAYAKFVKDLRMIKQVKNAYKNLSFKGREWALIPQLKVLAPTEIGRTDDGNPIIQEREMFSLSVVPPELQTSWGLDQFPADNWLEKNPQGTGPFIQFDYPHQLCDVRLTFAPSPFLSESMDAEGGMTELMGHFYEGLLVAAARLAGYGVRVSPQVLQGGRMLMPGRATPTQIALQASIYEEQALGIIDQITRIYIDHGMPIANATKRMEGEVAYWNGFSQRVLNSQSSRAAFAMNLANEINMTLARLEAWERRNKDAETDEAFQHLGHVKDPATGSWKGMEEGSDFWDTVDRVLGTMPWGEAARLQALGIAARYSKNTFEEAQGIRNILVGLHRAHAAMEGVHQVATSAQGVAVDGQVLDYSAVDGFLTLLTARQHLARQLADAGWGGAP